MTERLVSIIIPTYNSAPLLSRALKSVVNQTHQDWEALVIDNHSADNTDEVVAGFADPRIRLLKANNKGVIAVSRNIGLGQAAGKWAAFLDADDWWLPEKLALSLNSLQQGADIVYHDLLRAGPRPHPFSRRVIRTRELTRPVYDDLVLHGNALLNSSVVVRRDLLAAVGGLSENPRLVAAEDFECWLRLARRTDAFCRIPGRHGYYWIGNSNTSSPTRTLTCLGELRSHYLAPDPATGAARSPGWLSFALAKAHYDLGNREESLAELAVCRAHEAPAVVRMKAALLRTLLTMGAGSKRK